MAPPALARAKLEAVGIEWLLDQLEAGRSRRDIAAELGCSHWALNDYLHADPIRSARTTAAMEAGAEAYEMQAIDILARARDEIREEPQLANSIVALARERSQAAWRQASTRSPRYSDRRTSTDITMRVTHSVDALPTADLERLVAQHATTLELQHDGSVGVGGRSEIEDVG